VSPWGKRFESVAQQGVICTKSGWTPNCQRKIGAPTESPTPLCGGHDDWYTAEMMHKPAVVHGSSFWASYSLPPALWGESMDADAYRFYWVGDKDRRAYLQAQRIPMPSRGTRMVTQRTRADFDREDREKEILWERLVREALKETDQQSNRRYARRRPGVGTQTSCESWREGTRRFSTSTVRARWKSGTVRSRHNPARALPAARSRRRRHGAGRLASGVSASCYQSVIGRTPGCLSPSRQCRVG